MATTPRTRTPRSRTRTASKPVPAKTSKTIKTAETAAKPVPRPTAGTKAGKAQEAKPPKKQPKPVLVRDGFTMPEADFSLIALLKKRAAAAGREAKKSELLRAGLHALHALEAASLVAALNALERVKVGRPRKGH